MSSDQLSRFIAPFRADNHSLWSLNASGNARPTQLSSGVQPVLTYVGMFLIPVPMGLSSNHPVVVVDVVVL